MQTQALSVVTFSSTSSARASGKQRLDSLEQHRGWAEQLAGHMQDSQLVSTNISERKICLKRERNENLSHTLFELFFVHQVHNLFASTAKILHILDDRDGSIGA